MGKLATLRKYTNGSPIGLDQINYETAFIRRLEHRIVSQEKRLEQKQQIIEKLLINNSTRVQGLLQQDKAMKQSTKENFTVSKASFNGLNGIESEKNGKRAMEATKTTESESSQSKQRKSDGGKANYILEQNEAKKLVYLVGDSLLKGIHERGLTKKHNVKVKANGGATTRDIIDTIILHCGTNELTSSVSTIEQMEEILKIAKQESSTTKIVLSSVVTRADDAGIKKKVIQLNNKLRTFCSENGITLIDPTT